MKIARQAERSVIITFIFAGSKRPTRKEKRGERGGETYNEATAVTYIYVYTCLVVMESHNRGSILECFLHQSPRRDATNIPGVTANVELALAILFVCTTYRVNPH